MATTSGPSHATTSSSTEIARTHQGHRITKVGAVNVDQGNGGGYFTVYYCQNDHQLFSDIKS